MRNIEIGAKGEEIACQYLIKNRYLILARNHKEKFYEIDIIARASAGTLIFCEVKTSDHNYGGFMPEDNLSAKKYKKIVTASEFFLARHPRTVFEGAGWQIDLIAIVLGGGGSPSLRHYKNIAEDEIHR